jgi:uncharacterized MAPEG superfamily protein
MTPLLTLVVYMAIVTWASLLAASLIRAEGWTLPGMMLAMGNGDNLRAPSPLAGRADRAARNTADNFMLFAALAIVAHVAGASRRRSCSARKCSSGRALSTSSSTTPEFPYCARWSGV